MSQNDAGYSALAALAYREIIEFLPVGVFLVDAAQRIVAANPAVAKLLGVERDRLVGRTCFELLRCSTPCESCASHQARIQGLPQRRFPTEIRRGNGTRCAVLMDSIPLEDGSVAVLLRELTEIERARQSGERWVFHDLVCVSSRMKEIIDRIRDVAPFDATVLILGESGTGKELVARAVHAESRRSNRPFVAVNCSAYSENLLESELFGHIRGSFTGADRDRRGRFEIADGGTVFLDEVGEIPPKIQVKLLRVLQEREIERVGESRARQVDLRVVAATNRDLLRDVREGRFREDLYYRLNVFSLALPPLRARREDIPELADHFLQRFARHTGKVLQGFAPDVIDAFVQYGWPGNVRELENVIESAHVRARGERVELSDLPRGFRLESGSVPTREDRIREALRRTAGCVTRAARILGVHRTTLWRQMREAGIRREDFLPA